MSSREQAQIRDRAIAALHGLAIGDALGMPTQMMSRAAVIGRFGAITGFEAAAANHPLAAGLTAGTVTDDTEQALLIVRLLIAGRGTIDQADLADALVIWEEGMRKRGSLDLLGPSTKRAVDAVLAGESVAESGRFGVTNGAAMRIAPVGIVLRTADLEAFIDLVVEVSAVTHNTSVALAGAAAVGAAVSVGIDGGTLDAAIDRAIEASAVAVQRGYWVAAADVSSRIRWAIELADPADPEASLDRIYRLIGTSLATQESVPAAFGILATFPNEPWRAVLAAASLGGDSDTVAAMVGTIAGATTRGSAFPAHAVTTVTTVNSIDFETAADSLLALR